MFVVFEHKTTVVENERDREGGVDVVRDKRAAEKANDLSVFFNQIL